MNARLTFVKLVVIATAIGKIAIAIQVDPRWRTGKTNKTTHTKELRICSLSGGMAITRLESMMLQNIFRGALEDVEFIREYISESAYNQGIVGGLHDLEEMKNTLNWVDRNMSSTATTLSAGMGYADDRKGRKIERYVGLINEPYQGSKALDMAIIDSASNIFPWLLDRRSTKKNWWSTHPNGRLVSNSLLLSNKVDQLYSAAWIGTKGEAWIYYPSLDALTGGMTFNGGDNLGPYYNSSEELFIKSNLPKNNPLRNSSFTKPYGDTAITGLSLVTAQAPIYFSGEFRGTKYRDIYIASTGLDISMAAISPFLEMLEGALTESSFAFVVDSTSFDMVIISQSTVAKIYPARTGFEEERISYSLIDGTILSDRRNQTYLPSDTLFQSPLKLSNANWIDLANDVKSTIKGSRGWSMIDIQLSGEDLSTSFYAMYERWESVADWSLLIFTPALEVDNAINVVSTTDTLLLKGSVDERIFGTVTVLNDGFLDVTVALASLPSFLKDASGSIADEGWKHSLSPGEECEFLFELDMVALEVSDRTASSFVAFEITDADYPDCFYNNILSVPLALQVQDDQMLGYLRIYGLLLACLATLCPIGWATWVTRNRSCRVVRASQPIFLHLICGGIFLMGLSILPMAVDDSLFDDRVCNKACMATPWLLACGFAITFSALFSKIWRLNQIVSGCLRLRKVKVSVRDVSIPLVATLGLNVLLLTSWTIFAPLTWVREEVADTPGRTVGYCSLDGSVASLMHVGALIVMNFLAVVLAGVELYKARALSAEYSEGSYIAIALGSILQVFLTGLPILAIVNGNPYTTYFVKSTIVFVICISLLCLLFVPKRMALMKEKAGNATFNVLSSAANNDGSKEDIIIMQSTRERPVIPSKPSEKFEQEPGKNDIEVVEGEKGGKFFTRRSEQEPGRKGVEPADHVDSRFTFEKEEARKRESKLFTAKREQEPGRKGSDVSDLTNSFFTVEDEEHESAVAHSQREVHTVNQSGTQMIPLMDSVEMINRYGVEEPHHKRKSAFALHEEQHRGDASPRIPHRYSERRSYGLALSNTVGTPSLSDNCPQMPHRVESEAESQGIV